MTKYLKKNILRERQLAAQLLASSAIDLFPGVQLLSGQGTDKLFFYDFIFPSGFQNETLPLLEERMRLLSKQRPPIKTMEMMPGNAARLMEHRKQFLIAERLKSSNLSLVQIVQVGEFADWCEAPVAESWEIAFFFKLLEAESIDLGDHTVVRIIGVFSPAKDELKQLVKQAPHFAKSNHLSLIKELHLLTPSLSLHEGLWTWAPKGEAIRQALVEWWKKELLSQNFELITTPSSLITDHPTDPTFYLKQAHKEFFQHSPSSEGMKLAEISYVSSSSPGEAQNGLLEPVGTLVDRSYIFCAEKEVLRECISSLQFIIKIPKILGFEFEIVLYTGNGGTHRKDSREAKNYRLLQEVLKEASIEYETVHDPDVNGLQIAVRLSDLMGRWWIGPFLSVDSSSKLKEGFALIERSSFGSMERLLALLIEQKAGNLPFWLVPEQVRLLSVSEECDLFIEEIAAQLRRSRVRAKIDRSKEPLKGRLHKAMIEKIPFVVLIGQKEMESKMLTVRAYGSSCEEKHSLDEFLNMTIERE